MNYTLHKLPSKFIITSDEKIQEGDLMLSHSKTICRAGNSTLVNMTSIDNTKCQKVIAEEEQINFSRLSEEVCKKIGWFDVHKIAWDITDQKYPYVSDDDDSNTQEEFDRWNAHWMGFKGGFNKAQELLSDRMFTLEDIKNAFNAGENYENTQKYPNAPDENQYIKSLNSWKIELLGGYKCIGICERIAHDYSDNAECCTGVCANSEKPKFIDGKITITKIIL
jgi:hypothetical protein